MFINIPVRCTIFSNVNFCTTNIWVLCTNLFLIDSASIIRSKSGRAAIIFVVI
jgi:hypothetical protein